jgi:phosphoribosylamine--glycine ligase
MVILLLGSGGREHALASKMLQSSKCSTLFVAPGNAGTAAIATNITINPTDFNALKLFAIQEQVDRIRIDNPFKPFIGEVK